MIGIFKIPDHNESCIRRVSDPVGSHRRTIEHCVGSLNTKQPSARSSDRTAYRRLKSPTMHIPVDCLPTINNRTRAFEVARLRRLFFYARRGRCQGKRFCLNSPCSGVYTYSRLDSWSSKPHSGAFIRCPIVVMIRDNANPNRFMRLSNCMGFVGASKGTRSWLSTGPTYRTIP